MVPLKAKLTPPPAPAHAGTARNEPAVGRVSRVVRGGKSGNPFPFHGPSWPRSLVETIGESGKWRG